MKRSLKTLIVVVVVILALAVFTACNIDPQPTTTTTPACEHTGGTATCTDAAVCEKCGESYGEKAEHTIVTQKGKEVTCTEDGITEGKYCSVCMEVLASQTKIDALGHEDGDDNDHICDREGCTVVVTECAAGEGSHNCAVCGEKLSECEAAEGSHNCAICGAKMSDCKAGANSHNCAVCGEKLSECEAAANSHNCVICGNKLSEHAYDNSCDTACNVCGETRAITHTEETVQGKAPTCTDTGLTDGKICKVCGVTTLAQEVIKANGHKDENNDYECDVCHVGLCTNHEEKILDEIPATCTTSGLTEGKQCSKCGHIIKAQEVIPALNHSYEVKYEWSADNSSCTATKVCKNDASHVEATETATVKTVTLNVTATKVTYTYAVEFANGEFATQTKAIDGDVTLENNIATINAPAIAGRVASHDYVKFGFHDATKTYTFTIYYSEVDVWNGVSVSTSLAGSGTAEDPYLIQSVADFAYFAGQLNAVEGSAGVNYKVTTFKGQYFKMTKSIDLNGHALIAGAHAAWNNYQGFFGHFDGNNCSIRGISINNDTSSSSALFGCIAKGASVKNLSLYGQINGRVRLGGLAGYLLGSVDNITSYVTLTQAGTGNETGTVGGIIANQENSAGAITNCVNYGSITGESYIFGGIVGSGGSTITDCTNWGSVTAGNVSIGGISGATKDKGTITGCVNYGTIRSTSKEYGKIGGIVGSAVKPIDNCVNYGEVIANHTAGGIAGDATKEITNSTNYGKLTGLSCTSYSLAQITAANVTKTDCVENGKVEFPTHTMTHIDAKDATCEEAGNVAYDYCSECKKNYDADGKVIADVVLKETGHAWDDGVVADGKITFTCQNDASHTRVEDAKYIVTVNHVNIDGTVASAVETFEFAYGEIATINAKAIEGYVASHDYVKVHVLENSSVTIYYSEVSVWDGTGVWDGTSNVATSLDSLGGSGTQADPYIIDEAQDLVTIANIVNSLPGGGSSALIKGKYFKITKSIDLNNYPLYIGGFSGWGNRQIFNGHLDGNNCSIRGINNDRALFGCIEGTVNNLSLYGKVYNDKQVGNEAGLVGYLRGQVHYITNYVDVSGHTQVGGVVANLESKTASTHLTNYGTIRSITAKGTWSAVGGVIGCVGYGHSDLVNWGDVYSVGSSAGGIGGYGHASRAGVITNAYNYGTVYCNYEDKGQILGLIASHTYSNCHENGEVKDLPTEE